MIALISLVRLANAASPVDEAWTAIDKSLMDDSEHKRLALAALATIQGPNEEAVKRAESALQDKDPLVRQSAALAPGQMKARQAVPALQRALDDTGEVAFAAAKALTDIGDPTGRPMFITVLAGERKDTPGMLTNAIREAKKKLKHPEGLILMGAQDAAGAMIGPPAMGITVPWNCVAKALRATPLPLHIWLKIPIRTRSRCWSGRSAKKISSSAQSKETAADPNMGFASGRTARMRCAFLHRRLRVTPHKMRHVQDTVRTVSSGLDAAG